MHKETQYYSHGKLLLTGEYVVLDGAKALAVPTKFGQWLGVTSDPSLDHMHWRSKDKDGQVWLDTKFSLETLAPYTQDAFSRRLSQVLLAARRLQPHFLKESNGLRVQSRLEFDRDWGLGSSSTLINNIAQWANIDAFALSALTFGGSGYDIACAQNATPILYRLKNTQPDVQTVNFQPDFSEQLFFIHRNQKQNSRDGIAKYKASGSVDKTVLNTINDITEALLNCDELSTFETLLSAHEALIGACIQLPPVQESHFKDYQEGVIKSLGAWGGDFMLVTGSESSMDYFRDLGYHCIVPYKSMLL